MAVPRPRKRQFKKTVLSKKVGDSIADLRRTKGLSQEALAEKAQLSKNYIGNVERGEYDVGLGALKKIADALGVPASEVLRAAGA